MILFTLVLILKITEITNILNINSTSEKIIDLLRNYQHSDRNRRHQEDNFVRNSLDVLTETARFGDVLKYADSGECGHKNRTYVKRHIYHNILIDPEIPDYHWDEYKTVFEKQYSHSLQEMAALRKWKDNLDHVALHNQEFLAGRQSYALHLNHFADMSVNDYVRLFLKHMWTVPLHDPSEDHLKTGLFKNSYTRIPKRVDWRDKGFKPRREQQFGCGACYAFAVSHALQAQMYKKHRDWSELSPQQIVDCSTLDGNFACQGGSLRAAMRYVSREGLMMEKHYPYFGRKGLCLHGLLLPRVKPRRWAMLTNDEAGMEKILATVGPMAVAINASPRTFQLYRSGIYDDPSCTSLKLNHAMLLVGYSPTYWILLNWWGRHWGEDGYMRLRRGFNRCGVSNMAAYVEL